MCAGRADGTVGVTCSSKRSLPTYPVAFASRFSSSKPSCRATSRLASPTWDAATALDYSRKLAAAQNRQEVVALHSKYLRMQIEHASEFTPKPYGFR